MIDPVHPKGIRPCIYRDEDQWQNTIHRYIELNSTFFTHLKNAQVYIQPSLDTLCEQESTRRALPTPPKKKDIAYSATNRFDLSSEVNIESELLRSELQIRQDDDLKLLSTTHVFSKNSPLNGQSYKDGNTQYSITHAISSSSDRTSVKVGNLRRVTNSATNTTITYTGRVETKEKALEQASFIFFSELDAKATGISKKTNEEGVTTYEMHYAVNSLLSSSPLAAAGFNEREAICQEREILSSLRNQKAPEILSHPETGKKYKVQLKPVLFSSSFNIFNHLELITDDYTSGKALNEEINAESLQALASFKKNFIDNLDKETDKELISTIESAWCQCKNTDAQHPEVNILRRDYLFKLLNLPLVYHCKSSTDRTGVAIALSSALYQWKALKLPILNDVSSLLDSQSFKELFAINLMSGHQITSASRSFEGTVEGKTGNPLEIGYKLSEGLKQNPVIARLMPERYLKEVSFFKKTIAVLTCLGAAILGCIAAVARLAVAFFQSIAKRSFSPVKNALTFAYKVSNPLNWINTIPKKTVDMSIPIVGAKELIHSKKYVTRKPVFEGFTDLKSSNTSLQHYQNLVEAEEVFIPFKMTDSPSQLLQRALVETPSKKEFDNLLNQAKEKIVAALSNDILRTSLERGSPRALIVNGKQYGLAPSDDIEDEITPLLPPDSPETQADEIYNLIREHYLFFEGGSLEDLKPEERVELERKVFRIIECLYQEAIAPIREYGTQHNNSLAHALNLDLKSTYASKIELKLDLEDIYLSVKYAFDLTESEKCLDISYNEAFEEEKTVSIPEDFMKVRLALKDKKEKNLQLLIEKI
ncbi:MAG: hypothetical protein EBZ47_03990 [Chlamydiae bacterium]|nr:hypothetical protein [Chlamydiota bacterium]